MRDKFEDAPVLLKNNGNMCFMNTLFQNLYANRPFRETTMGTQDLELEEFELNEQPYYWVKKFMFEVSDMRPGQICVDPKTLDVAAYIM